MFALIALFSAQASECTNDSQCGGLGECVTYDIPATSSCLPFPWIFICTETEAAVGGECADDLGRLHNVYTDECMRPIAGSQSAGVRITNATCSSNSSSRQWFEFDLPNGNVSYANRGSGLCLTQVGNRYEQRQCDFESAQQFELDFETGTLFRMFHPGSSSRCVRSHPNVADPFRNTTCDVNNTSSRHWFLD